MSDEIKASVSITKEQAEIEFENWKEACDIDIEGSELTDEQLNLVNSAKRRFVKAMIAGRLTVDGEKILYTISDKSPEGFANKEIVIKNPGAKLRFAMDGFKDNQQAEKEIAGMSALTGQDVGFFRKLSLPDFNLIEAVMLLFMLS